MTIYTLFHLGDRENSRFFKNCPLNFDPGISWIAQAKLRNWSLCAFRERRG